MLAGFADRSRGCMPPLPLRSQIRVRKYRHNSLASARHQDRPRANRYCIRTNRRPSASCGRRGLVLSVSSSSRRLRVVAIALINARALSVIPTQRPREPSAPLLGLPCDRCCLLSTLPVIEMALRIAANLQAREQASIAIFFLGHGARTFRSAARVQRSFACARPVPRTSRIPPRVRQRPNDSPAPFGCCPCRRRTFCR
jgi:hypothetical protein